MSPTVYKPLLHTQVIYRKQSNCRHITSVNTLWRVGYTIVLSHTDLGIPIVIYKALGIIFIIHPSIMCLSIIFVVNMSSVAYMTPFDTKTLWSVF